MKHSGDLHITRANAGDFLELTEVSGYLYIRADAQLPVLTTVGGYLDISADAQLPVLTTVGGSLYIRADAQLPVLTTVGGSLDISADAQLPVLTTVGGYLDISADAQLPVLTTVGGSLDIRADNILFPSLKSAHGVEGRLVAVKKYGLWYSTAYKFYAGCQGPMTKNQALALSRRWDDQETAQYFAKFIMEIDDVLADALTAAGATC